MCSSDVFLCVLSIFFPPIGVWIKRGICSADSLINIALCCLAWFPGLLHAWYIILMYPDDSEYEQIPDSERHGGTVTYYYVSRQPPRNGQMQPPSGRQQQQQQPQQGYGTVAPQGQFPQQESGVLPQTPGQGGAAGTAGGSTGAPPPSYADAVRGDHKVQSHE